MERWTKKTNIIAKAQSQLSLLRSSMVLSIIRSHTRVSQDASSQPPPAAAAAAQSLARSGVGEWGLLRPEGKIWRDVSRGSKD